MRYLPTVFLLAVVGCGSSDPRTDREGEAWTLEELIEHLKAKKLTFIVAASADDPVHGEPAVQLARVPNQDPAQMVGFTIFRKKTSDAARDFTRAFGVAGFSWGRFAFYATRNEDLPFVAEARQAMGVP